MVLLNRRHKINKHASIGTHDYSKGKESVVDSAMWLVENRMH